MRHARRDRFRGPLTHGWRVALVVAAQLLLVGSPALAQLPEPRLWLAPMKADDVPGARLLSEKFDEAVRRQLERSPKLDLTDKARVTTVTAGESDPRVEQAENLRVAGKQAYADGDAPGAQQKLQAALKLYEEGLASINKLEAVAETLAYLGAAAIRQQFDADAKDYFNRLVAMSPDGELPEGLDGDARALYDKVKTKLLPKKRGSLTVASNPPGGEVRVDGVARGVAPITVDGLVRGEHYIQISHPEAGLGAVRTRVGGGKAKEITVSLSQQLGPEPAQAADPAVTARLVALAREGRLDKEFREQAEAIATQTRADYAVVGSIVPQGNGFVLTAFLYGVQEKQIAAFDEFRFRADLSSVFVQASAFATAVEAAVARFPLEKVVAGGLVTVAPVRPPEPVAPPPVAPATAAPAPASEPPPRPAELAVRDELPPDEPLDLVGTRRPIDKDDDDGAFYTTWWFWTGVGAVVVAGTATAGILLLDDDQSQNDFQATVRW
ncbi:MAG: PEGA domain-containing protein [bacterium]